ncbi:MAG: pyruvate kinase alpha/beta domain-containing protein [Promethearchaeota archaeon]
MRFGYFKKPGKENTIETLKIALENAKELNLKNIVIASTTGYTAREAIKLFDPKEYNLVFVTHSAGFQADKILEFDKKTREDLESAGAKVFTGTMAFSGISSALQKTYGHWDFSNMFARAIRTIFCDGIKVCMEVVLMAADACLIPLYEDVISIAGTGYGADTACLIKSAPSRKFFDLRLKLIFIKPL